MPKIGVIGGAGYVGLAYAAVLTELGYDVVGLDIDGARVHALSRGQLPIFEPGLTELVQRGLASGRLRFTTDYAEAVPDADFVFIGVGTPPNAVGRANMAFVVAAARAVALHARGHTVVVNKSTMPVGSVDLVADILAEHAAPGATFAVVSNPEFLREGSAIHDILHPDRIVLGSDDLAAAQQVGALYEPLEAPVLYTDPCSAEMIKYASNAFLAAKISFVNELAMICDRLGADVTVVARGMGMDARIGPQFLQAGAGFGGSCFPKDLRALVSMAQEAGLETDMLRAVETINVAARRQVVAKLRAHLGDLTNQTIAVLGLSFKPDTDDIRESPAMAVIRDLLSSGARVRGTDPVAMRNVAAVLPEVQLRDDAYAAATGADAVLLMTEWAVYRTLDLDHLANAMRGEVLVDGRNALDPAAVVAAGLVYDGIGRPVARPLTAPRSTGGATVTHVLPAGPFRPARTWAGVLEIAS